MTSAKSHQTRGGHPPSKWPGLIGTWVPPHQATYKERSLPLIKSDPKSTSSRSSVEPTIPAYRAFFLRFSPPSTIPAYRALFLRISSHIDHSRLYVYFSSYLPPPSILTQNTMVADPGSAGFPMGPQNLSTRQRRNPRFIFLCQFRWQRST